MPRALYSGSEATSFFIDIHQLRQYSYFESNHTFPSLTLAPTPGHLLPPFFRFPYGFCFCEGGVPLGAGGGLPEGLPCPAE